VQVEPIPDSLEVDKAAGSLMATARNAFKRYSKNQKKLNPEVLAAVEKAEYPDKLVDIICANCQLPPDKKIDILSAGQAESRLELLIVTIESENEMHKQQGQAAPGEKPAGIFPQRTAQADKQGAWQGR
jgi:ATP-dependent Lon protease